MTSIKPNVDQHMNGLTIYGNEWNKSNELFMYASTWINLIVTDLSKGAMQKKKRLGSLYLKFM